MVKNSAKPGHDLPVMFSELLCIGKQASLKKLQGANSVHSCHVSNTCIIKFGIISNQKQKVSHKWHKDYENMSDISQLRIIYHTVNT